jgi:hypothetical protein
MKRMEKIENNDKFISVMLMLWHCKFIMEGRGAEDGDEDKPVSKMCFFFFARLMKNVHDF